MMRHVLEMRAPDEAVRACSWFSDAVEQRRRSKVLRPEQVTRRDRMIYATQGGISDEMLKELTLDADGMHRTLADTIDSLNKFTHVQPGTMLGAASAMDNLVDAVLDTLSEFLDSTDMFHAEVAQVVSDAVNTETLSAFTMETIGELDELSTHTQVEDVEVEELKVVGIDARFVIMKGTGTVYVELVYGSGSDERRGDGARMSDQYPFSMTVNASTNDFSQLTIDVLRVDNSSFYK